MTVSDERLMYLMEICKHCGRIFYRHNAVGVFGPLNACPPSDGTGDFSRGPGTTFQGSGEHAEEG